MVGATTSFVCDGNVRRKGLETFCAHFRPECEPSGPKSHQGPNKFGGLQPGLYIRVPPRGDTKKKVHAYCTPFVPMERMTVSVLQLFFTLKIFPTEWTR